MPRATSLCYRFRYFEEINVGEQCLDSVVMKQLEALRNNNVKTVGFASNFFRERTMVRATRVFLTNNLTTIACRCGTRLFPEVIQRYDLAYFMALVLEVILETDRYPTLSTSTCSRDADYYRLGAASHIARVSVSHPVAAEGLKREWKIPMTKAVHTLRRKHCIAAVTRFRRRDSDMRKI